MAGTALLIGRHADYPELHNLLDACVFLLSAVLARALWHLASRTDEPLLRWLAASFAVTSSIEFIHILTTVEWSGPLGAIAEAQDWLRPATWPPAAYALPIGIASGIALAPRRWTALQIVAIVGASGVALVAVLSVLPRYTAPTLFGISRPTLTLAPLLWLLVLMQTWRRRREDRIFGALTNTALLLLIAHLAMLYSRSMQDVPAMIAHVGKFCGYLSLLLSLTQMASEDAIERTRAERQLAEMNAALEQTVRERTAELEAANVSLRQEIATRRTAELALADSHMRMRAIFETALDGVITVDHTGRIIEFNEAAERIFGYRRASMVGQKLEDTVIPPDLGEAHRRGLAHYLETGEAKILGKRVELNGMHANGAIFPLELSVNRMPGGGPAIFAAFLRDITARKEGEEKRRTQLARLSLLDRTTRAIAERQDLRSIFQVVLRNLEDNLPIDFGCIGLRPAGESELSIACIGARSHVLATRADLSEQSRVGIDENGLARCAGGTLVYEPDLAALPFTFPKRLAQAGLRSLVLAPLIVENQVFGVLMVARLKPQSFTSGDCEFLRQLSEHVALAANQAQLYTALQTAYADLRETQHAVMQQERLRALGQMASGIAHDINNALSPASLYVQSLLEREANLSHNARNSLQVVQRAIEDVAETVARMREFYRPRERMTMSAVNLNKCLQQVIELTRVRWSGMPQQHGAVIDMRTELAASLPDIAGAEAEIRDALTNLVLNAVDAMPDGGTLTLRSGLSPSGRVQVEVVDTGIGMSEKARNRCLEPFFTTKGERGTGLGLAMVYGMAQRHGADLEIDSEPGAGTTMRLIFAGQSASTAKQAAEPAPVVGPLRILLIDDDPLLLKSLQDALEQNGHLITPVDGGQAGIDAFAAAANGAQPFALVITDLGMPYIDGRTVAAAIKSVSPTTPVILLTGWGHRLVAEDEVPPYVDRVLSKPPKLAEIRAALSELARGVKPSLTQDAS
jgi:PAS domain S-box-containing protein